MKIAKEIYLYAFATIFVLGFFYLAIVLSPVATTSPFIVGVIETLKMGVILILGYFFGSSKSSADKNDLLYKSTPAIDEDKKEENKPQVL